MFQPPSTRFYFDHVVVLTLPDIATRKWITILEYWQLYMASQKYFLIKKVTASCSFSLIIV